MNSSIRGTFWRALKDFFYGVLVRKGPKKKRWSYAPRVSSHWDHISTAYHLVSLTAGWKAIKRVWGGLSCRGRDAHLTAAASAPCESPSCLSAAASRSPRWSSGSLCPPPIRNIQPSFKLLKTLARLLKTSAASSPPVAFLPLHKVRGEKPRSILQSDALFFLF